MPDTGGMDLSWGFNTVCAILLGGLGWWMKKIDRKVDEQERRYSSELTNHRVHVAEVYATKEMVDKVETKVVSVLNEFRGEIREDLQRLLDRLYQKE